MFQKGDYIIYGGSGVCLVEEVGPMDMAGAMRGKLYYTLRPMYSGNSTIFTPTDNDKIVMRPILTREEAERCLESVELAEPLEIGEERKREEIYREVLRGCDCGACFRLLKTIYGRQHIRLENGKKVAALDERYMKMAEDSLFGELAASLGEKREEVRKKVYEKISEKALTTNLD